MAQVCSVAAFDNLHELTLLLDEDYSKWSMLTKLLEKSSNLESLVLEHEKDYPRSNGEDESRLVATYKGSFDYIEVPHWSPPKSLPTGFLSHLKTICIKGFKGKGIFGYQNEKELLKYLLKTGQVLQKLTIYTPGLSDGAEEELYEEFSTFEWGSKTCQVEIIKKVFVRRWN